MNKKVKYRGRWFSVISETEKHLVIESYGTNRTVLKDEVVYEDPVIPKDIVEDPVVKETEILLQPDDKLSQEPPKLKDLIQKESTVEAGTYEAEILGTYPNGGTTTYKVIFEIYGDGLDSINFIKITDVDTGGTNDLTPEMNEIQLKDIESKVNEKIKNGEINKINNNEEIDETVPNVGVNLSTETQPQRHNQVIDTLDQSVVTFKNKLKEMYNSITVK